MFEYIKRQIIIAGINRKNRENPFDMEACERFQLPADASPMLNNSYYFGGNSTEGESLIFRFAFRINKSEAFVLYTHQGRFYAIEGQEFGPNECPITVECMEPGNRWHCTFNGKMRDQQSGEVLDSHFDVVWTARLPIFDSSYHCDPYGMATPFSRERWTKQFLREALASDMGMSSAIDKKKDPDAYREEQRRNAQHHYEQTGKMKGTLTIGTESFDIDLAATRDHSFGKRDWNFMCAHIWLMAVTGAGETLNLQLVNYPRVRRLYTGYTDIGEDHNVSLHDFDLLHYDHNDGKGTDEIVVNMHFNNGKTYHVRALRDVNILTPFDGGNFYFQEGIANFDINGIPARGTMEYGYNKNRALWRDYSK